ncbi:hypothetical protein Ddye_030349 [Dipteronia dyeriana]|uniref:Cysteine-rich receptor-like protein kinase n=1 Tax=Dipteronia dyeriana TaxID=168575 RepID=A0AAD9TGB9_9ROSI|nr:hypothetical protein Ddye_030349 [Dipteronia dyeriana]
MSNYICDFLDRGVRISDPRIFKDRIFKIFKGQYKKDHWNRLKINSLNFKQLTEDERVTLERPFSEEEVWEVVSTCDSNKAPGPDGMNLNFIKAHWKVIKADFINFINGFLP